MIDIAISEAKLDLDLAQKAFDPATGAIDIFVGTVRNQTAGKRVLRLEFESYRGMAEKEMKKIAEHIQQKWPVQDIYIHHRVGTVDVGQIAVIIIVTAARRDAAFQGCRYAIDTLKQTVPIWKKEIYEDGAAWVQPHP